FWSQWVYDRGHPRFEVAALYDTTARNLTLTVKQTQTDSSPTDSTGLHFETAKLFRMPVTIRVGTASGDVVRRVQLTAREQTIEIPGLAGVAALGQLGGARAAELARATFLNDPSYAVRAAALTALVRADSTARDSAIAWGLATSSYQDVIQEAAYRIIAQTGDTGAIP